MHKGEQGFEMSRHAAVAASRGLQILGGLQHLAVIILHHFEVHGILIFCSSRWGGQSHHFAIITSEALTTAKTSSPFAIARSSTASLVMDDVTMIPPPMSIRTWAVV